MLETLRCCLRTNAPVRLDENFRLDLNWWRENLAGWNGVTFLEFKDFNNMVALDASTDGSILGGPGLGGFNFINNEWFKCTVPDSFLGWIIADYELLAHIISIRLWGHEWAGLRVWGLTDSEPCELLLRNWRSRHNKRLQMARTIASLQHQLGFEWVSGPVRSSDNVLPDCASRWGNPERRDTFWKTCEALNICPTERFVEPQMFHF